MDHSDKDGRTWLAEFNSRSHVDSWCTIHHKRMPKKENVDEKTPDEQQNLTRPL
ncbi:hypothetical protein HFA01_14610 [Halobacillus faecis]|uniref:Uncharacterized protein n=1 Tax=Halobacillus faecis TaxID=360184 RepID=A0A511WPZ1_9BACI|nr:hypothetical protein HFA01_14610 [Halobacillus faecis]